MYFGCYTHDDQLDDATCVREDAKIWVLADYLDAFKLKNCAMRSLYRRYFPEDPITIPLGIGPQMVEYCLARTLPSSRLFRLIEAFLVQNWDDAELVLYNEENRDAWNDIQEWYPEFAANMKYLTQQSYAYRDSYVQRLEYYLETGLHINYP